MLVINHEEIVPAGGFYVARCDQSGAIFKKHTVDGVVMQYREHCRANGYPELSREQIVQLICRDTPANICAGEGYQYKERSITLSDVANGTRVLASFLAAGSPLVAPEVAEERAAICANCQENVPYRQSCTLCTQVEDAVKAVVGDMRTSVHDRLQACYICACSNKAQVWLPAEILAKGVNDDMMERFKTVKDCWKWKAVEAIQV